MAARGSTQFGNPLPVAAATGAAAKAGRNAVNVSGGVVGWSRAGLPLTR